MTIIKPSDVLGWIPDNTTNITNPGSVKTAGFTSLQKVSSSFNNWLFNRASQWIDFVNNSYFTENATITVTNNTELDELCEKLKKGFMIDNDVTVTINFGGTALTPTSEIVEINNIHGGKLYLSRTSGSTRFGFSISSCSSDIKISNFSTIWQGSFSLPSCLTVKRSKKVSVINCHFNPQTGNVGNGLIEVDSTLLILDTCTGQNDTFGNVYKITNNGFIVFDDTVIDDFSGDASIHLYSDVSSGFSANCDVFANISSSGAAFPAVCLSGNYPKLITEDFETEYSYNYILTTSNEFSFILIAKTFKKVDGKITINSYLNQTLTETFYFSQISGSGEIEITSDSGSSFEYVSFSRCSVLLDVSAIVKSIFCNYCSNGSLRGTFGGLTSGATKDCIQTYNSNIKIDGTIRYWTTTGVSISYNSRVVIGSDATITPATDRSVIKASGGSICQIYETLSSGDILEISEASIVGYNGNIYMVNVTI